MVLHILPGLVMSAYMLPMTCNRYELTNLTKEFNHQRNISNLSDIKLQFSAIEHMEQYLDYGGKKRIPFMQGIENKVHMRK